MTLWSNRDNIELVEVPTVEQLFKRKLATVAEWNNAKVPAPSKWRILPEGQELINQAMATNAARLKEHYGNQGPARVRLDAAERDEREDRPQPAVEDWPF